MMENIFQYVKNIVMKNGQCHIDHDAHCKKLESKFEKDYKNKFIQLSELLNQELNKKKQISILFMGQCAVGKSSLLKYLINGISKQILEVMNISEHGEGTKELVVIESEQFIIYDYRGKNENENPKQYIESLESAIGSKFSSFTIDVIFFVMNAYNIRNDDIKLINDILSNINDYSKEKNSIEKTEFYVFLNKYDKADTIEKKEIVELRLQEIRNTLKLQKCKDKRKLHKYDKSLLKTIHIVSSNPSLNPNDFTCDESNINDEDKCKYLKQTVCHGNAIFCLNCNTLYESTEINKDSNEYKTLQPLCKRIEVVEKDYHLSKNILNSILNATIKQKQISDFIDSINECYKKIFLDINDLIFNQSINSCNMINYRKSNGKSYHCSFFDKYKICYQCSDRYIYHELSSYFGFEYSKNYLSKFESERWERINLTYYTLHCTAYPITGLINFVYNPGYVYLGIYAIYYSFLFRHLSNIIILDIIKKKSKNVFDASEKGIFDKYSNKLLYNEWKEIKRNEFTYISRIQKIINTTNLEYACQEFANQNIDISDDNFENLNHLNSSFSECIKVLLDTLSVPYKKFNY